MTASWMSDIAWNDQGLIPVIAQDATDKTVLMMAWMNAEALQLTVDSGKVVYYSRSRQRLWPKGETSGHEQLVRDIRIDCDNDVILIEVDQKGSVACHTGRKSCFFKSLENNEWQTKTAVLIDPETMYGDKS